MRESKRVLVCPWWRVRWQGISCICHCWIRVEVHGWIPGPTTGISLAVEMIRSRNHFLGASHLGSAPGIQTLPLKTWLSSKFLWPSVVLCLHLGLSHQGRSWLNTPATMEAEALTAGSKVQGSSVWAYGNGLKESASLAR